MSIWLKKDEKNFSEGTKAVLISDRQSGFFMKLGFIFMMLGAIWSQLLN